ncbi:MAG: hypothetical protein DMF88_09145 [Acidobacteria bacterium]|nr:MAG: hypothetical protein DMF88_09145 [Acidobacteriota bacterium]
MIRTATVSLTSSIETKPRIGSRRKVRVPGRLTWRDSSGTLRFVSVVTSDVSDLDVFVECQVPASIPLYRLVHFQIERGARECDGLPAGYALRLLVEPSRKATPAIHAVASN